MAYRLVLLDDEPVILEGMQKILDWQALDIEIVGAFEHPEDALNYILENPVDIAIVDICIPEKSGLDFISEIQKSELLIHCIILSGYNDFTYAKKAVGLGVHGYVLKPVVVEELIEVLKNVKECVLRESISCLRDLEMDIREHLTSGSVSQNLRKHFERVNFPRESFSCFCISPKRRYIPVLPSMLESVHRFAKELKETGPFKVLPLIYRNNLVILTGWDTRYICEEQQNVINMSIRDLMAKNHSGIITGTAHSSRGSRIEEIHTLYKQAAKHAERDLFFLGYHDFVDSADIGEIEKMLYQKLKHGDTDSLPALVHSLISARVLESKYDVSAVKEGCKVLLSRILFQLKESLDIPFTRMDAVFDQLNSTETHKELNKIVFGVFRDFIESVGRFVENVEDERILKIKKYVDSQLSSKITLEDIARKVYLNPSYISIFFKLQTGKNLKDYIAGQRVSKAINMLLHTDMKVYEISDRLGYNSTRRFSDYFRRHTGSLPTQYRQRFKMHQTES